jgi:hypothetical protein
MSAFVAMLAAAIGIVVGIGFVPYVSFALAGLVLHPIKFVVAKISPWDQSEDFHPRTAFFMNAFLGLACAICVSGALVCASYLGWHRHPHWPLPVIPGAAAFVAACFTPILPYFGWLPVVAAAVVGIPAAGIAARFWG